MSFLLIPVYTRFLTPYDYGILDMAIIIITLSIIIFTFQLSQAIARFYTEKKKAGLEKRFSFNALFFSCISFLPISLLLFIFSQDIATALFDGQQHIEIVKLLGPLMFFQGALYSLQSILRYNMKPKPEVVISIFLTACTLAFVILFVVQYRMGALGVIWAQFLGFTMAFLLGMVLNHRSFEWKFSIADLREMIIFSWPLIFSSISVFLYTFVDRLVIKSFLGFHEMGLYGVGVRISTIAVLIMTSFGTAANPLIYKHYMDEGFSEKINVLFRAVLFVASCCFLGITLFAKEIILLFTTEQYFGAHIVIPFLVAGAFISQFSVFVLGLEIAKKTKLISIIYFFGGLLNFGLNIWLVPIFGIIAAASTTLATAILILTIRYYLSQRNMPLNYDLKLAFFLMLVLLGLVLFQQHFVPDLNLRSFIIKMGIFALFVTFAIVIRILPIDELRKVIQLFKSYGSK